MHAIMVVCVVCENLNRVLKRTSMPYDEVVIAFSFAGACMELPFLFVKIIADTFNITFVSIFFLLFTGKGAENGRRL